MSNLSTSAACAIYVEIPSCQPPPGPAGVVTITEVAIGDTDPYASDPASTVLLWYAPTSGMFQARVGNIWVPISTGAAAVEEVLVQLDEPEPTNPAKVWYDTPTVQRTPREMNFPPKGVI